MCCFGIHLGKPDPMAAELLASLLWLTFAAVIGGTGF